MKGRHLRSNYWRNLLFESSDGRCNQCGKPLDTDWHADHIIPYSVSGETDPFEMQALCPSCNLTKGTKMQPDWLNIDRSKLRPGQREAIDHIMINVRKGKQNTAIVLPPGYGKSDVIRVSATILMCQERVSRALIITPAETLRSQAVDRQQMRESAERYKLPRILGEDITTHEVKQFKLPFPPPRFKTASFFAATIQLVNSNLDGFIRWAVREKREHGVPLIVYFDEAHTGSTRNHWGNVVKLLLEAGAFVVLLTATPFRSDQERIEGFDWEEKETTPVSISRPRVDTHGETVVDIYEGRRTIYALKPDFEYPIRKAWDVDIPPSLCKMTRLAYDFDLETRDRLTDEHIGRNRLSELPPHRLVGEMGRMLREDKVIEFLCESMLTQLRDRRLDAPKTAAIVFIGNNEPGEEPGDERHARRVEDIIRSIDGRFDPIIATSSDARGAKKLREFQKGQHDILVVKQMGGVGYDVPRLKVELDLSTVRAASAYVQRIARVARIWQPTDNPDDAQMTAVYITPDDALGAALWQFFIAGEYGETSLTNAEYVRTVQALQETDRQPRLGETYIVDGVTTSDFYSDTQGQVSPGETLPVAQGVIRAAPPLQRLWTIPDVEKAIPALRKALSVPEPAQPTVAPSVDVERGATVVRDADAEQKADSHELQDLARRVAEKRMGRPYRGRGDTEYTETVKEVQWQHKWLCGLSGKKPRDYTEQDVTRLKGSYLAELRGDL